MAEQGGLDRFAALLDRLAYEPRRNAKIALIADHLRRGTDPERGYALAALTGELSFANAKAGLIRGLVEARVDPVLFALSYDYVGDLSETVALIWPRPDTTDAHGSNHPPLSLTDVVETLSSAGRTDLARILPRWLDQLDETGRWACLKLITGAPRVGVSARLAKTALGMLADPPVGPDAIEEVWPDLAPPYAALFAWIEGRGPKPERSRLGFTTPMLAHALEEADLGSIDPSVHAAEWKWDGIRVQAVGDGRAARLYSRSGEDISRAFPDLLDRIAFDGVLDGELLVVRDGRVQPFSDLQQRLNRTSVSVKTMRAYPAHLRAYDLLAEGSDDLRPLPFSARRARLEAFVAGLRESAVDVSPLVPFERAEALAAARADPASVHAGPDAAAIEGLMLKRRDSAYVPGRPKGLWFKWKREPYAVDCVLMYAQRGHGKRSSFYSDFTFGVWRADGTLVPVGKAYFGFTDEELKALDRFVRQNTTQRFGPVREVAHTTAAGLVLEIAFEGLQRSTRHKSGVAMRFPRIARIRWDKPTAEADRLETLEAMLGGR